MSALRRRTLAAVCVAALWAVGCADDQQKAANHVERARGYLEEERPKEALLEFRSALKLRPQDAEINYEIAEILEAAQQPAEAAFFYGEAYRLDATRSDAALSVARLVVHEDTDRAEQIVNEVLQREPDNAEAFVAKSEVALMRGDADAALVAAVQAVEFAPKDPRTHLQAGRVHQARVRLATLQKRTAEDAVYEAAVASFDRSAELAEGAAKFRALNERARIIAAWPGHQEQARGAYRDLVEAAGGTGDLEIRRDAGRAAARYAEEIQDRGFRIWALERLVEADPALIDGWVELSRLKEQTEGSGEAVLRRLVELRPDDGAAHVQLAVFLARTNKGADAIAQIQGAIERGVQPPLLLGFLADLQRQAGDESAAAATRERLLREYPDDPSAKIAEARRLMEDGKPEAAAEAMRTLAQNTNNVEALSLLASAELRQGRVKQAQEAIDRILELNPDPLASVQRIRSRVAFASQRWSDVIDAMRKLEAKQPPLSRRDKMILAKALEENGHESAGRAVLATMADAPQPYLPAIVELARAESKQDPAAARARLEAALEKAPGEPGLLRELSVLERESGNPKVALERINLALAAKASGTGLLLERALVLMDLGDLEAAERDALQVFQARPGFGPAGSLLVEIYSRRGKLPEAARSLEEADSVGALSSESRELLARIQAQLGQDDRAIATLEKIVAERSDAAGAKNDLAFLLAKQGKDLDRALRLAQEARDGLGDLAPVADTLGYVYLRKQLYTPAADQFREAVRLGGSDPEAVRTYQYHLGMALRGLGRDAEAAVALEAALAPGGEFAEAAEARRELEEARRAASAAPSATP